MENCHHDLHLVDYLGLGEIGMLIAVFLTGLAGSFTHCIGMCGPLAMMQANMRLMNTSYNNMTQLNKLKAAFTLPYYLGKAISYSIILTFTMLLSSHFRSITWCNYVIATLMICTSAAFVYMGVTKNFSLNLGFAFPSVFTKKITNLASKFKLEPYGFKGVLLGIILGLIPCAFVIAIVMSIIAATDNLLIGLLAITLFALSTVPGLFVASYFGNVAFNSFRNYASFAFRILAFLNALFLFCYALKVL